MDNVGGKGGIPTSVGEGSKTPENAALQGEVKNFGDYLNQQNEQVGETAGFAPETVEQNAEAAIEVSQEVENKQVQEDAKAKPAADSNENDFPEVEALKNTNIQPNAERLSKESVKAIANIFETYKNDPRKEMAAADEARWVLLKDLFNRGFGDGLNGSGAK